MFQNLVRHTLTIEVRATLTQRDDFDALHEGVVDEVNRTRFLGLGTPSESGTRILYDFRQVNELPENIFVSLRDLCIGELNGSDAKWANQRVHRLIFVDDFCGTGNQAAEMSRKYVPMMREVAARSNVHLRVWYLTLLATTTGLVHLRQHGLFDRVESVSELDKSYRVFGSDSQFYINPPKGLIKVEGETIARHYGGLLCPGQALGYGDCQLLLGFHHNVPDNTLPIISQELTNPPWHAIFRRIEKY